MNTHIDRRMSHVRGFVAASDDEAMRSLVTLFMLFGWRGAAGGLRVSSVAAYLPWHVNDGHTKVYGAAELVRIADERSLLARHNYTHPKEDEDEESSWEVLRLTPYAVEWYQKGNMTPLWLISELSCAQVLKEATENRKRLFVLFRRVQGRLIVAVPYGSIDIKLYDLACRLGVLDVLQRDEAIVFAVHQQRLASIAEAIRSPGVIPRSRSELSDIDEHDLCHASDILSRVDGGVTEVSRFIEGLKVDFSPAEAKFILWSLIENHDAVVFFDKEGRLCIRQS